MTVKQTDRIIVVIGDIVSSKKIKDRVPFDALLQKAMAEQSAQNNFILSPYTLTLGDEIQAVLSCADTLFNDVIAILSSIYPQKMRFSFGIGTLVKPINPEQAIGMDGPAFYNARDRLIELKKSGYLFDIKGEDISAINLIRQTLFLISHKISKWNRTRLQTLLMVRGKVSVKEIAGILRISEQAVYKTIDAGAIKVIIQLFNEIESIITESVLNKK